jgi:hypothetical protein
MGRTRDVDPILRRTVFHGPLSAAALPDPRILTIAQREKVVQYGLGDREMSVRKAAASMLGGWVDQAGGDLVEVRLIPFDGILMIVSQSVRRGVERDGRRCIDFSFYNSTRPV